MQDGQRKIEDMYGKILKQKKTDGVVLEKMSVVLGTIDTVDIKNAEEYQVESFLVHPEHTVDDVHDTYDLALVRLTKHISYSIRVQPVCLPTQGENFSGFQGLVVGWGRTQFNGTNSRYLKQARVQILDDATCERSHVGTHFAENPKLMICAFEYKTDACQGDSGGPLLYKDDSGSYIQAGIVSWGIGCAHIGFPGVYTEVSYFTNWITNNSKDGKFCSRPK